MKQVKNLALISLLLIIALTFVIGCTSNEKTVDSQEVKANRATVLVTNTQDESKNDNVPIELYCESDDDCACGISIETADCTVGNRDYILNGTEYVQDGGICETECYGEIGQLEINCVSNKCVQK